MAMGHITGFSCDTTGGTIYNNYISRSAMKLKSKHNSLKFKDLFVTRELIINKEKESITELQHLIFLLIACPLTFDR